MPFESKDTKLNFNYRSTVYYWSIFGNCVATTTAEAEAATKRLFSTHGEGNLGKKEYFDNPGGGQDTDTKRFSKPIEFQRQRHPFPFSTT
eukprot:m.25799 g.25799  ORF g.25799 m.25799 type:complete len:90 (+) comp9209_c0_seq1:190-459(+)